MTHRFWRIPFNLDPAAGTSEDGATTPPLFGRASSAVTALDPWQTDEESWMLIRMGLGKTWKIFPEIFLMIV